MQKTLRESIIQRNLEQSKAFCAADARLARKKYRVHHPTEIIALKCMDGRLNLSLMTQVPVGIIQPFRNIGGRFDLGWPYFGETIYDVVQFAAGCGRDVLVLDTYHFSKGDTHRGCAGFKYDTAAAKESAENLRTQFQRVYGPGRRELYPIVVGIETDEDGLVFHGIDGGTLDVSTLGTESEAEIEDLLKALYPDMPEQICKDLLQLVIGNRNHVKEVRTAKRTPIEMNHREQLIAVGRGFPWLHLPNKALIIGPYSHDWPDAVATAAKIVTSNLEEGRVDPEAGILLLISSLSRQEFGSAGWNTMVEKAKYLERVSLEVIKERQPDLIPKLDVLTGVVAADTLLFHSLNS